MHKCVVEVRMHILMHKYSVNITLCTNAVYTYPYAQMQCKHILMHKCSVYLSLCTNTVYTYTYAQIPCKHILMHKCSVYLSLCTHEGSKRPLEQMAEKSPAALAMAGARATSAYLKPGLVHTAKSPLLQAHT